MEKFDQQMSQMGMGDKVADFADLVPVAWSAAKKARALQKIVEYFRGASTALADPAMATISSATRNNIKTLIGAK